MKKLCRYCKRWFPESNFGVAATYSHKIYRRHKCQDCYRATKKKLVETYRQFLLQIKKTSVCFQCGIADYRVLDFHHRKGEEKIFELGSFHRVGLHRIKKEIEKCLIICANCHRIVHFEERGSIPIDGA